MKIQYYLIVLVKFSDKDNRIYRTEQIITLWNNHGRKSVLNYDHNYIILINYRRRQYSDG